MATAERVTGAVSRAGAMRGTSIVPGALTRADEQATEETRVLPTLAEFGAEHLPAVLRQVSKSTRTSYEIGWRLRVRPSLGGYRLDELSPMDIEDAYFSWSGARSTKTDARAVLSRILQRAVRERLIWANPAKQIELPRQKAEPRDSYALTEAQLSQLFTVVPRRYRLLFGFMAYAGLRLSEATAVTVGQVEVERRLLLVNAQLDRGGHRVTTKSGKPRYVPILPELLDCIEAHGVDLAAADPRTLLCTSPLGKPVHPSNLARELRWREVRDEVRPGLRWHDLRHHAATTWLDMGIPAHDVREFMGHSSLAVTSLYTTAGKQAARRTVERFYGSMSGLTKGGHSESVADEV